MTTTATPFTPQQQRAIETRQVSVALSAGAGCGKTFVLTERFLSHLEPADDTPLFDALEGNNGRTAKLHELVAITFTDRAAREMRDRIRKKCYERLKSAPPQQVDHWLRLLRSLDTARVSTIHAFCGALLRSHAVEARLDPRFSVIEQSQADTLLAQIIEDTLREKLAEQDPAALDLATRCGLERLKSMVGALVGAGKAIDFQCWLYRTPPQLTAIWEAYRREVVVPLVLQELSQSAAARELLNLICEFGDSSGELKRRCDALSDLLPKLATSQQVANDLDAIVENARVQGAGSKKTWPSEAVYERFKCAAEKLRDDAKRAKQFLEFNPAEALDDAVAGLQLLELTRAIVDRYESRKTESAWLDFNDLLVRARDLLTDPAHADLQKRLASQLTLLLVDECQDTDPVQVELIQALCGAKVRDGKLFFVGDFKQSIYRFRGADPNVFRALQESTPEAGRLPLSENFRSQPAILEFVNAFFCDALSGTLKPGAGTTGSLAYQALLATRPQAAPLPAVEFIWAVVDDFKKSQAGARDKARRKEADYIARRIRQMLDAKEPLVAVPQAKRNWSTRAVEQKDIALLFRTLSDVQHYEESLRRYNIDYYLVGGHAFYAQQEIFDLVNLLRTLASPADEVSLAGVLRSPMFALTDETLFWLAEHPQGLAAGLFAGTLPKQLDEQARRRIQFAAATLRQLRSRKDRLTITGLLNEALALTGYDAVLLSEFLGERKLANLRKLQDQARAFDQSGALGLADFIVQLSEFVVNQPREPLAATQPEQTDVVRLMTIHQAKGLEFPVVFVPDIGRSIHSDDHGAVWDSQLGPLVKLPAKAGSEKAISGLDLYNVISSAEDRAERIRLLYVATTRAADYLVLSSGIFEEDLESPAAPWLKLLSERFDLKSGKCTVNLPEGYAAPAVKVAADPPALNREAVSSRTWRDLDKIIEQALQLANSSASARQPELETTYAQLAEPLTIDRSAQRRFSVSRLTGELKSQLEPAGFIQQSDDDEPLYSPMSAADLGTLVHQVLSRVRFDGSSDVAAIVRICAESAGTEATEHMPAAEKLIADFMQSARARQLAAAQAIHRELEFLLNWPPGERAGNRYLQGFIDCLYQDAGGAWHLLDYKTSRVAADTVKERAMPFAMQLGVYALAVEQILGRPPVELAVNFLRSGAEHRFTWDNDMRQQTIAEVNRAMAAATTMNHQA